MSIFDKLKGTAASPQTAPPSNAAHERTSAKLTFAALPESLAQMRALPEAALTDPFQTAALTVCALCVYAADKAIGTEMLNFLRGPRPLSPMEISFLDDRFRNDDPQNPKFHVPFSYFDGAIPANDYTPNQPFALTIDTNPYSDANAGYKKLFIRSGGADSPREIVLRMSSDGKWYLWDQFLLVGIRKPKSADPWA